MSPTSQASQPSSDLACRQDTTGTSTTSTCLLGEEVDPNGDNADGEPADDEVTHRPSFITHLVTSDYGRPGLYYHGIRQPKGKDDSEKYDVWICSPLECQAMTHDERGDNHGLLLRFRPLSSAWRTLAMPMEMLKGNGEELRGILLNLGLRINPSAHKLLTRYLMDQQPKESIVAATRVGWHLLEGKRVFVMPRTTIGASINTKQITFQSEHVGNDDFITKKELKDWRTRIGELCSGNPWLILSVATALTGPLLNLTHRKAVGIHLYGDSSGGKTTALEVAASVWGGPDFKRTWNGTGNGQEAVAAALSDTAIILDEISEADSRNIGNTIYMLGNGAGKARAARTGMARQPQRWRIAILSSGERTLAAHMRESGLKPKAGQTVRLLDIPAKRTHGLFDDLHGFSDGRAFADHLKSEVSHCYGTLGPAFIKRLIANDQDIPGELERFASLPGFASASPLQGRAAKALALIGLAGELATEFGLTGWREGEAVFAAISAFSAWKAGQGGIQSEDEQILASVKAFIERHGDARFSDIERDLSLGPIVHDRAGYWQRQNDGRIYLLHPAALEEALAGFDIKRGLDSLEQAGWIIERDKKARSTRRRINGTQKRFYAIRPASDEDAQS
nr:DUF927 domain-containing protein [uncultured Halomonas sp.]